MPKKPAYAIKAAIDDPNADTFVLNAQRTMYGGKQITAGNRVAHVRRP